MEYFPTWPVIHHWQAGQGLDRNDKLRNHNNRQVVQENWAILCGPGAGLLLSFTCPLMICVGLVYITFVALPSRFLNGVVFILFFVALVVDTRKIRSQN